MGTRSLLGGLRRNQESNRPVGGIRNGIRQTMLKNDVIDYYH